MHYNKERYLNPRRHTLLIKRIKKMKILGYILSALGLATIAFSKVIISKLPFLAAMAKGELYTIIGGFVLIAAGVAFILSGSSSSSSNVKQASQEVPIYEGEGRKRKIIGYQRAK